VGPSGACGATSPQVGRTSSSRRLCPDVRHNWPGDGSHGRPRARQLRRLVTRVPPELGDPSVIGRIRMRGRVA
jgi:hypothetical protein